MKKKGLVVATVITIFCLLLVITIFIYILWENIRLKKENMVLNKKCEELNKQIDSLKQNLIDQQKPLQGYLDYISRLEKEIDELKQKLKEQAGKKTVAENPKVYIKNIHKKNFLFISSFLIFKLKIHTQIIFGIFLR